MSIIQFGGGGVCELLPCQVSVFASVQFSRDFIRAFNDRIKHEYEKIESYEKSHCQSFPHPHQINKHDSPLRSTIQSVDVDWVNLVTVPIQPCK